MNIALHRLAASAISVLLLVALVLGGCIACAQPVEAKSKHHCCEPKDHCKRTPAPAQTDHSQCDREDAALPESPAAKLAPELMAAHQTVPALVAVTLSQPLPAICHASPPPLTPLQQTELLRI